MAVRIPKDDAAEVPGSHLVGRAWRSTFVWVCQGAGKWFGAFHGVSESSQLWPAVVIGCFNALCSLARGRVTSADAKTMFREVLRSCAVGSVAHS